MKSYWDDPSPWRQKPGETFWQHIARLATFVLDRSPLTEAERKSIDACPPCYVCGEQVFLTPAGRLDIRHDYHRHFPRVARAPEPPPGRRRGLFSSRALFGERDRDEAA